MGSPCCASTTLLPFCGKVTSTWPLGAELATACARHAVASEGEQARLMRSIGPGARRNHAAATK
jgi:hypothetical protein